MSGHKTENYFKVLIKVQEFLTLNPTLAIFDYEKAEQKAIKMAFPQIAVMGCFFHYSQVIRNNPYVRAKLQIGPLYNCVDFLLQALIKNAEKQKILRRNSKKDDVEWGFIKLLITLGLLPEHLIEEGFKLIKIMFQVEKYEKLNVFCKYYENTWIKGYTSFIFVFQTTTPYQQHNGTS